MASIRIILARNIKKYRALMNISQEELAYRCNLHRTYVSDIERCTRNVSIDNIEKLAAALQVSPFELLREEAEV